MEERKSLELKNRAEQLHNQVVNLSDDLAQKWKQIRDVLLPIYRDSLFKFVGYKSWSQYIENVVKAPISSINNYVIPATHLLNAGYDLSLFDEVPSSRVTEISKIVKQSGKLEEEEFNELISAAKKTGTRKNAKDFKDLVGEVAKNNDVEEEIFIRIPVSKTVGDLFELAKKAEAKLQSKKRHIETYSNATLLEGILATYLNDADVRYILRSFSDEDLSALFDWGNTKVEVEEKEGVWI